MGGDGDLVLQALTLQGAEAFVLREVATQRAPGVGVCVSTLRDRLAAARGLAHPTQLDDLEALACFSFMGNDYLPALKEGSFERLWRTLCALRRHPALEGERLLVAERTFNRRMLRALLVTVGKVYRGVSTLVARDVEAGVAPSEARRRHALVGLAPEELAPVVEAVVAEVYELGLASRTADGVIRVKGPGLNQHGNPADKVLSFANAEQYLGGVLWTLAMYTDGVPSNYAFVCEAINAPAASTLAKYLQRCTPAVPASAAVPLPAPLVCASLLPPDALRAFAPAELARELDEGRSLAFISEAHAAARALDPESRRPPPLDYDRMLSAAAELPPELVERSRQLSASPAWLSMQASSDGGRGRGRDRGGRGGRGRGRGRGGPAASDEPDDLPSVPRLPPDPPMERLRPLRVSASAHWVRVGCVPRRQQWADVPREQERRAP